MNLIDQPFKIYGNAGYRGACPTEALEQITFFNRIRAQHPKSWGLIATHIRNEGKRNVRQAARQKAEGLTSGASDIIIPGRVTFICEMKRRDHTKSKWQPAQIDYLTAAADAGAFACVALGCDAAWEAFGDWIAETPPTE